MPRSGTEGIVSSTSVMLNPLSGTTRVEEGGDSTGEGLRIDVSFIFLIDVKTRLASPITSLSASVTFSTSCCFQHSSSLPSRLHPCRRPRLHSNGSAPPRPHRGETIRQTRVCAPHHSAHHSRTRTVMVGRTSRCHELQQPRQHAAHTAAPWRDALHGPLTRRPRMCLFVTRRRRAQRQTRRIPTQCLVSGNLRRQRQLRLYRSTSTRPMCGRQWKASVVDSMRKAGML